jgi:hypothetical protein
VAEDMPGREVAKPKPKAAGFEELRGIRTKYFAILEEQVITPATTELTERITALRGEADKLEDQGSRDSELMRKGLLAEADKLDRALEGLQVGAERVSRLRLRDLPSAGPAI